MLDLRFSGLRFRIPIKYLQLTFWFLLHFFTDAISIYILFSTLSHFHLPVSFSISTILLYNFIAFVLELPIGIIADRFRIYRSFIIFSLVLQLLSLFLTGHYILTPVILTGLANALFHIGAGSLVLSLFPKSASAIGLFIAPGALGVMVGSLTAGSYLYLPVFSLFLLVFIPIQLLSRITMQPYINSMGKMSRMNFLLFGGLLLLIIFFRSLTGSSLVFLWKKGVLFVILSAIAAFFGKASGGIVADKRGYAVTGIASILFSIPFILAGNVHPAVGLTGMLLFQMTTAITISFLYRLMPDKPGLTFGLTTAVLFAGSLPMVTIPTTTANLFPSLINAIAGTVFGILSLLYLYCASASIRDRIKL